MFGFQAERMLVWIDAATPDQVSRARSGALCKEHADRLTAPRGWHLDDRRQPVPQLFRTPPGSVKDATGSMRRRRPASDDAPSDTAAHQRPADNAHAGRHPSGGTDDRPLSLFDLDPDTGAGFEASPEPEPEPEVASRAAAEPVVLELVVNQPESGLDPAPEPQVEPEPAPTPASVSHLAVADPTSENSTMALELELPYQVVVRDSVTDSVELQIDSRYTGDEVSQLDERDEADPFPYDQDDEPYDESFDGTGGYRRDWD